MIQLILRLHLAEYICYAVSVGLLWLAYHLATLVHSTLVCIRFYTLTWYARSISVLCLLPFAQSNIVLFFYTGSGCFCCLQLTA